MDIVRLEKSLENYNLMQEIFPAFKTEFSKFSDSKGDLIGFKVDDRVISFLYYNQHLESSIIYLIWSEDTGKDYAERLLNFIKLNNNVLICNVRISNYRSLSFFIKNKFKIINHQEKYSNGEMKIRLEWQGTKIREKEVT